MFHDLKIMKYSRLIKGLINRSSSKAGDAFCRKYLMDYSGKIKLLYLLLCMPHNIYNVYKLLFHLDSKWKINDHCY